MVKRRRVWRNTGGSLSLDEWRAKRRVGSMAATRSADGAGTRLTWCSHWGCAAETQIRACSPGSLAVAGSVNREFHINQKRRAGSYLLPVADRPVRVISNMAGLACSHLSRFPPGDYAGRPLVGTTWADATRHLHGRQGIWAHMLIWGV